jgi:DNA-directed RNA polymerase specialized sigma24 family protein
MEANMDMDLTKKILAAKDGRESLDELNQILGQLLFHFVKRIVGTSTDLGADFIADMYPRLSDYIQKFTFTGTPFEHYFFNSMRWRWICYSKNDKRKNRLKYLLGMGEPLSAENFASELDVVSEEGEKFSLDKNAWEKFLQACPSIASRPPLRLLLAFLSYSERVTSEQTDEFCRSTGYSREYVESLLIRLRDVVAARRLEADQLHDACSETYVKLIEAEGEAQRSENQSENEIWTRRAAIFRKRLKRLRKSIRCIKLAPTHTEIGGVIGVSKGTVDSGLHYLKENLNKVYNEQNENPVSDKQPPQKNRIRGAASSS